MSGVTVSRKEQKERETFLAGWNAFRDHYGELFTTRGQTDFSAGIEEAWEKFHEAKAKPKASVNEEFETACSLWRMEFAHHTFQAVRSGIEHFFERKLHSQEPEYYPMTVGLVCLYARPFTNNRPVGPLSEDIVPQEHLGLHRGIIKIRHKLFAHGDASVMTRPDDYPNELVFVNKGKGRRFNMTRFFVEPPVFECMNPLLDALIEKTRYHSGKFANKLKRHFGPFKNIGEFRLNVLEPTAPIFSKLTATEKVVRESTIRPPPK
jgi:hypothetical protein